jgi:hypothetical protein
MIESNDAHRRTLGRMLAAVQSDLPPDAQMFALRVAMRSDEEGCVWLDDDGMPISPEWMDDE